LYRITRDHTLVEDMVRHGVPSAEEAAHHRWRHVITNAVGADSPEVTVEVHKVHLEGDDRVLLCSDGLTNMVSEQGINQILQNEAEPERACRRLVARANEAGGKDNITVILAHFSAANQPQSVDDERLAARKVTDPRAPVATMPAPAGERNSPAPVATT